MPWTNKHLEWLSETKQALKTEDGINIKVFELNHKADATILSAWARHFRNHYCFDKEIDTLRSGTGLSREEYLNRIKFPDVTPGLGPPVRAGDFAEILVGDYLEFLLNFWVPRLHYRDKNVRNESHMGIDMMGFKIHDPNKESINDSLAMFAVKARLTGQLSKTKPENRLQNAIDDSVRDEVKKAESLNAIKQKLIYQGQGEDSKKVIRFQNITDKPFQEVYGAAVVVSHENFDVNLFSTCSAKGHPHSDQLMLIIIRGDKLMDLVHELYRRAACEA